MVRSALGRTQAAPEPPYPALQESLPDLEAQAEEIRNRLAQSRTRILDKLDQMARLGGWNVFRAGGFEEAIDYVVSLAGSLSVERVVRSDQPVFNDIPLDAVIENQGLTVTTVAQGENRSRESLRQEMMDAGLGITGAD